MKLDKYYNMLRLKRIANLVISLTAIASLLIILFTIYGNQVGNFVITVEEQHRYNLSLSESPGFEKSFSRLAADGLPKMRENTWGDLPEGLTATDGSHNDTITSKYMAYTFYVKNNSPRPISYYCRFQIVKLTKNVDSAIRIMIFKNADPERIYAKWREDEYIPRDENGNVLERLPESHYDNYNGETGYDYFGHPIPKGYEYTATMFNSAVTVFEERYDDFPKGEVDKYTVVIWIEGMDPQCTNNDLYDIRGGSLKMEMEFSVVT